jgi:hypothetical protein
MYKLTLTLTALFISYSLLFSQEDVKMINETVNTDESAGHVWFLASDELKGRDTGSPEIDIAAAYIASQFRSYGVKPMNESSYFQMVPLESISPPVSTSFSTGTFNYTIGDNLIAMEAGALEIESPILYSEHALPDEISGMDVKGKIIVARAGAPGQTNPRQFFGLSQEKRKAADAGGAVALIETYSSTTMPWSLIMNYLNRDQIRVAESNHNEDDSFSHMWVSDPQNELSSFLGDQKAPVGNITMQSMSKKDLPSKNVVGFIEGTDSVLKDEYVLLSAHYDHVGFKTGTQGEDSIFNGARDNAIGTAAILTAAKSLAANPPKRSIILLACTGEEKGLLGSRYFSANSPVPINKIVFNLNSDGGGYNDTSKAGIMGLTRTNAEGAITSACEDFGLGTIADPAPEQNLFDRSDNVNFARLGIPAPTFSTGFTSFDEEITKYYHQVTDNPETLDYEYLAKFFKAYALAARRIANMNEKPFWNEGDKYEAAGKKLYGIK